MILTESATLCQDKKVQIKSLEVFWKKGVLENESTKCCQVKSAVKIIEKDP